MPDFVYRGTERVYPETRDSFGVNVGMVKDGDILRFDQAPDQYWAPYEGGETGTEGESGEPPADPETPETTPQDVPPGMLEPPS